jgi:cytoskeletal protein RodZ
VRGVTFFQRFKTPFTDSAADDQMRSQPRMRLVGEFLQERREDLGLDLDEIGAMLRIKPGYLAALEQGRSHDLPGPTYAIGFIRAYADFLGLDADQVLVRFKAEAAGATARPDLALPVPLGERSLPGGALVLVALIVALCGYGIWYYLSTDERDRPQRVAAVPAALQTAPVVAPALVSPGDATAASSAANSPPAQASTAPAAPPLFGAAATPVNAPAAAPPAGPPPSPQAPSPAVPPGTARMTASAAPTQPAGPVAAPSAPPPPPTANAAPRVAAVTAPAPATQLPATQPAAPPLAAAKPVPASAPAAPAAADPTATRIAIRALSDCWIQVRGPDQAIVFSRVLKSGEVYKVPSRAGLSLRTGNAGALEIAVDGKTAPAIGGVGTLRRDVVLDPSELAAGTAVHG